MSLYTEIATREGAFSGYVKPLIEDLDILGRDDKEDPLLHKLWEGLVGAAGSIVTNPKEDQVATKIPMQGRLEDPDILTWAAVIDILRNAFIRALEPAIDREIDITSPLQHEGEEEGGFLKNLFGSGSGE
jgi:hypothetical protein